MVRRHSRQRGVVLMSALFLAILYFALMELLMLDASRALKEAQRFRSRVIAATLAETGAELAATNMIDSAGGKGTLGSAQGKASGTYVRTGCCNFELTGEGAASGVPGALATVRLQGRILGSQVTIDYATHSQ